MQNVLSVILAGGKGSRLEPLTRDRAKPAVPFGGVYRIVDFALSNCLNSGLRHIQLLTQYKGQSLDRHANTGWQRYFCRELGEFIDVIPPQQRIDEQWYQGTADAVYQNIYAMEKHRPDYVMILAGDHIYKMNYASMIDYHIENGADLTIGALRVSTEEAKSFGVMQVDTDQRIVGFEEKSPTPKTIPGEPDHCLASMGIYVFNAHFLFEQLCQDATRRDSAHDFGKNIIPSIIDKQRVFAFPFRDENRKQDAYWRDVGTLDAYFEANMDLVTVDPLLNLYDQDWPLRTYQPNVPPPKFVFAGSAEEGRRGCALDSIVCGGSIISGGEVERSIIGANVRVNSFAHVEDSILFEGVNIGRHTRIRRAIIDKGVHIPSGTEIGFDLEMDRRRGFTISSGGVVVIAKGDAVESMVRAEREQVIV
ncbi:glucose-1-phosphate adenylyltransferase [Blastopirellula sp. J2-11]|uniref:glucose-1-phosphate adenylyltransferase n=1 Tax=Blastopirellula sp. J2-11 TaxID=2943192 RepID=UPI0021C90054|nr:glucose-1-phosphate adenylyltransferase [Blastopirellula sp. J2-11]UUO06345.1 glucose-1-phosphate adenylyltransferase [Blastopirellula sp. J2-11]